MADPIGGILFGAIGGIGWSLIGLAKEKTSEKPEPFDAKKMLKTVILGGIVGGYAGYTGASFSYDTISALAQSATFTPIVAIVDKIVGIIWNLFKKARK